MANTGNGDLNFVSKLWQSADKMRNNMDAAEYKITGTYHAWRAKGGRYKDEAGFCLSAKLADMEKQGYKLTPGRYVGTEAQEEDAEAFDEKMKRLTTELSGQFKESHRLEAEIKKNLKGLGCEL
jgi:type I restriction enzyme M protein